MKSYELESFLKSFLLFLVLLEVLLAINFWHEYEVGKQETKEKIRFEMKLCAYTVQCEGMQTDFVERSKEKEENTLYEKGDFYSYFHVPTVEKYLMKVVYPKEKYLRKVTAMQEKLLRKFLLYSLFAVLVSFLFAVYALMPLRRALRLNEEFVKDILHDFNTPLSSMKINLKLLQKETGHSIKIERIENNIETMLSLQKNLRAFLKGIRTQAEVFDIEEVLNERISYFRTLYPDIRYISEVQSFRVETNRDAFSRVVDNILSNAGKYNDPGGNVVICMTNNVLKIKDTGKGIAHPEKVFSRYYKEQERGIGIGLHIVKKLCDEMSVPVRIESKERKGTEVSLELSAIAV